MSVMLKNVFFLFFLCYIISSETRAGLLDSLTAVNTKNASIAKGLPKKKNSNSKYSCISESNKKPLEVAVDAHEPVKFTLEEAIAKNVDVNKLSEKQLEAIGDAAIAEKLKEQPKTTSKKPTKKKKGKHSGVKGAENEKCEN